MPNLTADSRCQPQARSPRWTWFRRWTQTGLSLVLVALVSIGLCGAKDMRISRLPAGNPITDGKALLRNSLPIDNPTIRQLQASLEDISAQMRANRRWPQVNSDISKANRILQLKADNLVAGIPDSALATGNALVEQIKTDLASLQAATDIKDREQVLTLRAKVLDSVGALEELMVPDFPYEIPAEYSHLPSLKGRATIAFTTNKGDMTAVVDGYSAPLTAGNFVDLVQRGFYDGLPFTRSEESYVLQIGDPPGPDVGFIDPDTKTYRAIPLEVMVQGDAEPTYGITLEDAGRFRELPVLPFSAFGALALARPGDDPNGGSSQFFFFLFEPELTPAGANLLDGRYAVFGYVTEGKDVLDKLRAGDTIISAKVVDGLENLVQPKLVRA
jgi:peptidylprolyl isomerase